MTQYICMECGVVVRSGTTTLPQHCGDFMTETEIPEIAVGESPYHNLVYHTIREHQPLTGAEVHRRIGCSPGTVYPRIEYFDELGVIESRPILDTGVDGKQWATDSDAFDDHGPEEYRQLAP